MSVLVGYLPEKGGRAALQLGAQLAHGLGSGLHVATVVPRPWPTPSLARVDAEFTAWAAELGETAARSATEHLAQVAPGLAVTHHVVGHRSVPAALTGTAAELDAEVLVLGSSADGQLGQVVVGSTADRLLHSSPVALALAPRGYRSAGAGVCRLTSTYAGTPGSSGVLARSSALAARLGAGLRVATFARRGATMHPPEVGLRAEDEVLAGWVEQSRRALAALRADGTLAADVETEVATGRGWREAVDQLDWRDGELLVVGSSESGVLARVFLGSRAAKLVRHSPVPVLVLPR